MKKMASVNLSGAQGYALRSQLPIATCRSLRHRGLVKSYDYEHRWCATSPGVEVAEKIALLEPWAATTESVGDLWRLVEASELDSETLAAMAPIERAAFSSWAARTFCRASDNIVVVPPAPRCLERMRTASVAVSAVGSP